MKHPGPFLPLAEVERTLDRASPGQVVHLVGAGGCGMSGLGHLLLDLGFCVTGSDLVCGVEVEQLRQRGARIVEGHVTSFDSGSRPFLVVQTSAVKPGNPEIESARAHRIPVVRRGVLLAALAHRGRAVCVAGMHGKTTTTALLAHAMQHLGLAPGFAIGALLNDGSRHARMSSPSGGLAPFFVLEADESDGSLAEFLPEHAILLNVDAEHLDFFGGFDRVCEEFGTFARQVRERLVYCKDDAHLDRLCASHSGAVSYGLNPSADYRLESRQESSAPGEAQAFDAFHRGLSLGRFGLQLLGEKNALNALAVLALLHQLGHQPRSIAAALAGFQGACRRQQLLWAGHGVQVYDDYGHHPNEIRVTLRALKPTARGRLLVAFQPHRFTRTQHLLTEFATAFMQADVLWLTDIYPASEAPIPGVNGEALARAVRAAGQAVHYAPRLADLGAAVLRELRPGDTLLFLGAGDITQVAQATAGHLMRTGLPGLGAAAETSPRLETLVPAPASGAMLSLVC
jgi:UDP-N-acetylmuramate--alanine ligase